MFVIFLFGFASFGYGIQVQNAPFIDLGPTIKKLLVGQFGIGIGYEVTFGNYLSGEVTLGYDFYKDNILFTEGVHEFVPGVGVRIYFSGTAPAMAWLGLIGQYYASQISGEWGGFGAVVLRIGYKVFVAENAGFFVDPYLGFSATFLDPTLFGSDFGVRLGWAF